MRQSFFHIINKYLIYSLIVLLPLHSLFIYRVVSAKIPFANYWKEGVLLLLIFTFLYQKIKFKKFDFLDLTIIIFSAYTALLTLFNISSSSIYGWRNLNEPLLFLLFIKSFPFSLKTKLNINYLLVTVGLILSIYGIFQVVILGENFLLNIYHVKKLHHSFYVAGGLIQRNVGTFSSPNIFGMFLSICILTYEFNKKNKKIELIILVILSLSLILTFSRSVMLGLFLVILFYRSKKILFLFGIAALAVLFLQSISHPIYFTLVNFFNHNVNGSDPSIGGHLDSLLYAFELIKSNWILGVGLGSVGPKAVILTENFIDIESSLLSILLDTGVIGLVLYLTIFLLLMRNSSINRKIIFAMTPVFLLLPNVYEVEIMSLLFIILSVNQAKTIDENI